MWLSQARGLSASVSASFTNGSMVPSLAVLTLVRRLAGAHPVAFTQAIETATTAPQNLFTSGNAGHNSTVLWEVVLLAEAAGHSSQLKQAIETATTAPQR